MTEETLYVDAWPSRALLIEHARVMGTTPAKVGKALGLAPSTTAGIVRGRWTRISWKTAERIATLKKPATS